MQFIRPVCRYLAFTAGLGWKDEFCFAAAAVIAVITGRGGQ